MAHSKNEIKSAKELGILGVPADQLYTLRRILRGEDCPLPLYGSNKTAATHGWFPFKLVDDKDVTRPCDRSPHGVSQVAPISGGKH
jgi:hypothetical protein